MPVFCQAAFVRRAVESLLAQSFQAWELLIVDDGSPGEIAGLVAPYLADRRIQYERLTRNGGLGAALNYGLDRARAPLVAYLPADDVYYEEHLASLVLCLDRKPDAVLAYSGVRHHYNRAAECLAPGEPLQLVQVLHRRTDDRWTERYELVTDDLDRLFWDRLRGRGACVGTGRISCEWVDHPHQHHKLIRRGINRYREHYGVTDPIRFRSTTGLHIDEIDRYRRFRERPDTPPAAGGLTILLVGELAYNPERVLALEERGHRLYGLWMPEPEGLNTVGPLPFGHVRDLPRAHWREEIRRLKPDIIYALLNWQAVPFAHEVMRSAQGVPFVWHFKEGPFICLEKGTWGRLVDLHSRSDGCIYSSPEQCAWFATAIPAAADSVRTLVLDGDLPKRDWFDAPRSRRLSEIDGELHTVIPGRPIGLHVHLVAELAALGVHLHFYGESMHHDWAEWIPRAQAIAPNHLHLHAQVAQDGWVSEFSKYDAGWLHFFESENGGDLRRANWDDLNYPARLATFAAAGLPVLQRDNPGAIVATQALARDLDIGVFVTDMEETATHLRDEPAMERLRDNAWRQRDLFTFDHHADRLVDFFRDVIAGSGR
ncbi:MAG TPA: glycosyltransferase family A protein [Thermomicrobiales bacterium]|nr:glycosyltransferase family A protein [Thermomicrobiales bacterium]